MTEPLEEVLPRVLAIAWGVVESPQRGPKRELSHERIVEAAIEVADAEGLAAVTMQRVAESFGFTTMSLYRYVANKDELQRLMADAAFALPEDAAVDSEDWQQGLRDWAELVRRSYRKHPWLLEIMSDPLDLLMPNQMRAADLALRALRTLPVGEPERLAVLTGTALLVRAFALFESIPLGAGAQQYGQVTRDAIREVATAARFPELWRFVQSGVYLGEEGSEQGADFDISFGIWVGGVADYAARSDGEGAVQALASPTPQQAFELAEAELRAAVATRKAAEQRVKALYKREAELQKARDAAKEFAKAAQRAR